MLKKTCFFLTAFVFILSISSCGIQNAVPISTYPSFQTHSEEVQPFFSVTDPFNLRGLCEEKRTFTYGIARDGKPHAVSVENQNYFDRFPEIHALAWDRKSEEKVLYLTFDCGYEYNGNTKKILDILANKEVSAAFFCTLSFLEKNPETVQNMADGAHIIGNHSKTHPVFPSLSRTEMAEEIFAVDQHLKNIYGYNCRYFRFPEGIYSENALELAASRGKYSVFWSLSYADWGPNNQKSTAEALDTLLSRLHPGAVILLHAVSDTNAEILGDFIDLARAEGYSFQSLDFYYNHE